MRREYGLLLHEIRHEIRIPKKASTISELQSLREDWWAKDSEYENFVY